MRVAAWETLVAARERTRTANEETCHELEAIERAYACLSRQMREAKIGCLALFASNVAAVIAVPLLGW